MRPLTARLVTFFPSLHAFSTRKPHLDYCVGCVYTTSPIQQGSGLWAGTAGYYAARTSQEALAAYAPVFAGYLATQRRLGVTPVFGTLDDFVERSSALVGSPQQVIDKVHRYHEQLGHSVMHLHADAGGLTDAQHRASLELFQSDIAPVLRRDIPDPPWPSETVADPALAGSAT